MIIEGSAFGALTFLIIGLFGISLGGIVKGLFGGGSKTSSTANYDKFLQDQAKSQREHEQRMAQIAMAQQKKTGMTISPIMIFGGVAVVAMIFLPQIMGRRR
ncbi:hypothetical protein ES702_01757 [subsurface metagenome]